MRKESINTFDAFVPMEPHQVSGVFLRDNAIVLDSLHWEGDRPNFIGEVRLAGLCRSDLKEASGSRAIRSDFGHEIVLTVRETLPGTPFRAGDRVVLDPHIEIERTTGFAPFLFARADLVALTKAFIKVPDDVSDEMAVLCEPLACAMHAVRALQRHYHDIHQSNPINPSVAFTSAGLATILQAKILRSDGSDVRILNRSTERLEALRGLGISEIADASLVHDCEADQFDAVVVSGAYSDQSSLKEAIRIVRPGGVIVLFGGTKAGDRIPGVAIDIDRIRRKEMISQIEINRKAIYIAGTYGATISDFNEAIRYLLCANNSAELKKLLTEHVGLNGLSAYINRMNSGKHRSFGKTVVITQDD